MTENIDTPNTSGELAASCERLAQGTFTKADLVTISAALRERQFSLATGERAISLGGDANHAVLVTGDSNTIINIGTLKKGSLRGLTGPSPGYFFLVTILCMYLIFRSKLQIS